MTSILSDHTGRAHKIYRCDQCGKKIEIGERYRRQVYVDDDLCTYRAHDDCDNAAAYLTTIHPYYDDPPNLCNDICPDDCGWLLVEFPSVANRLGCSQKS